MRRRVKRNSKDPKRKEKGLLKRGDNEERV
jgi:hypothetical protein